MTRARRLTLFVALASVASSLAGCGQAVGYPGALPAAHTRSYANESAPALPAGVDVLTALLQRPMRPPDADPEGVCWASSHGGLRSAPDYGAGAGPVYLSGQDTWYAFGQAAVFMFDPRYSGPMVIRPFRLGGNGTAVALVGFSSQVGGFADKEQSHGVTAVAATEAPVGGLYYAAVTAGSSWRASLGELSTDGPGCFGFQVDGSDFTEFIVFEVNAGAPPPG